MDSSSADTLYNRVTADSLSTVNHDMPAEKITPQWIAACCGVFYGLSEAARKRTDELNEMNKLNKFLSSFLLFVSSSAASDSPAKGLSNLFSRIYYVFSMQCKGSSTLPKNAWCQ